jgi:hypothetical protein
MTFPINATLEEAAKQFQLWRASKKSKFEPVPDTLKVLAKQLLSRYPKSKITEALQVHYSWLKSLKNGLTSNKPFNKNSNNEVNFIPFKLASPAAQQNANCTIIKPNGTNPMARTKLIINCPDILTIVKTFLCSN